MFVRRPLLRGALRLVLRAARLSAEAVQGLALALERVDDVHGGHRLAAGVLRLRHRVADDVLQEHLEHAWAGRARRVSERKARARRRSEALQRRQLAHAPRVSS